MSFLKSMVNLVQNLQNEIIVALEAEDGKLFKRDPWQKNSRVYGQSAVIQEGNVIEKGGVNISVIEGELPEHMKPVLETDESGYFYATGLSLIIHPFSPRIPTIHMNIRYFELKNGPSWFGGGIDLTPYYPEPELFKQFHLQLKSICDKAVPDSYQRFKKECDDYFYLRHRKEMRGIGGVFFDHLDGKNPQHLDLVKELGRAFNQLYIPWIQKFKHEPFRELDKQFQLFRRGRYVEFNLLYDRGTKFGLEWGGRVESILVSLPLNVTFPYQPDFSHDDKLREMISYYQPRDWV